MIEQTDLSDRDVRLDQNEAYNVHSADSKTSKKYKLQHTNAFVSYNSENECLFGCKLCRTLAQ